MKIVNLELPQVLDLMIPLYQLDHRTKISLQAVELFVDILNGSSYTEKSSVMFHMYGIFRNNKYSLYKMDRCTSDFILKDQEVSNAKLDKIFEDAVDFIVDQLLGGVSPLEENEHAYLRYRFAYRKMLLSVLELIKKQFKI